MTWRGQRRGEAFWTPFLFLPAAIWIAFVVMLAVRFVLSIV